MARTALLVAAAVVLVAAMGLGLVPFEARLATEARDGTRLSHTVGLQCRAPVVDGLGGGGTAPRPCVERARFRLGGSAAAAVAGTALLSAGLRRTPRPRHARHHTRR